MICLRGEVNYGNETEDLLQFQCAKAFDCDVIITNNKKDFSQFNGIPVLTPEEFLLEYWFYSWKNLPPSDFSSLKFLLLRKSVIFAAQYTVSLTNNS